MEGLVGYDFRPGEVQAVCRLDDVWDVVVAPCGGVAVTYRLAGPDAGVLARGLAALPEILARLRRCESRSREADRLIAPPWQQGNWCPPRVAAEWEEEIGVLDRAG